MLNRLTVKNVALISSLELVFCPKLNILSGETGAGKSIIVDSLMLLSGGRFDKSLLKFSCDFASVEGEFTCTPAARASLLDLGLEADDELLIVFRRIGADGKNEIRINGRSVTLSMLKSIMGGMIDICGQNEHQILENTANHLKILDYYVRHNTQEIRQKLSDLVAEYREVCRELDEIGDEAQRARSLDIYKFQADEIAAAKIKEGELESLTERRKRLAGAEKLAESLGRAYGLLSGDESVAQTVKRAAALLGQMASYGEVFGELSERLDSAAAEIDDVAETVSDEVSETEFSPAELDKLDARLDTLLSLKRKYGDYAAMTALLSELNEKIDNAENAEVQSAKLIKRREALLDEIYALSLSLSEKRKAAAGVLETSVINELAELNMASSRFELRFEPFPGREECAGRVSALGMDKVEFYLSPNAGQPLKPLIKIISGGELSRLMLALKVVSSAVDETPVMIFDEIDTGISGKVGLEVAKKLARLSLSRQILCVTHLPQIAAFADKHFFIGKSVRDGATYTEVKEMDAAGAIEEIARLTGSKDVSDSATASAGDLKDFAERYKKEAAASAR